MHFIHPLFSDCSDARLELLFSNRRNFLEVDGERREERGWMES